MRNIRGYHTSGGMKHGMLGVSITQQSKDGILRFMKPNKFLVILLLPITFSLIAMEEQFPDISHYSHEVQNKLINSDIELALENQIIYLGLNEIRNDIETILGKKFPTNTIFIKTDFTLPHRKTGLESGTLIPEYIPYDIIQNIKEGDTIQFSLGEKLYAVTCKQHRRKAFRSKLSFEEIRSLLLQQFSHHAGYLSEDEQELLEHNVITKDHVHAHGTKCSPYVKK